MTSNVENNPVLAEDEEHSAAAEAEAVTEHEVESAAEPEAAAESENGAEADGAAEAADETADAGEADAAADTVASVEAEPEPEPEPSLPLPTFAELGLPEPTIEAARELGYAEPTFAQAQIIPVMSLPHDVIVCGAAGADKAAAYLLGLLSRLPHEGRGRRAPRALIVVPTRQVAQKLALAAIRVARATDLFVSTVYGGAPFAPQVRELKGGTDVLIATPGRLCELMTRDAVDLSHIKTLVVDEADIIVDLGFALDVNVIANATPRSRRTLMFCASSDPDSLDSLRPIVASPEVVNVSKTHADKPTISQYVVPAYLDEKPALLEHLLDMLGHERIVMYAHTKTLAQSYAALLEEEGISTGVIHSDSLQAQRNAALADFNCGRIDVLVTTDEFTAANVARASHIINLTLPDLLIEQASRVEQAGHLDAGGCIVSIVDPDTCCLLRDIEAHRAGNISVMKVEGYDLNYAVLDTVGRYTSARKAKSVASKGTVLDEEGNVKRYKGELDWIRDLEAERRAERRERETLERLGIIAKDDSAEDEQRDERRANGARNGRGAGARGDGRGRRREGDGRDARSRHREGDVRASRFEGEQREDDGQRSLHPDSADFPADVRDGGDIPTASLEDAQAPALQAQGAADVDAFERVSSELAEASAPSVSDKEASVPSAGDKPDRDADDEGRNSREARGNRDDRRNREERGERRFDNKRSGYKRDGGRRGESSGYKRNGGRSGGYRRDEGGRRGDERRGGYRRDDDRRTGGYQRDGERYGQGDGGKRGGYRGERSGGYRRDDRRYDGGSFKGKRDGERQGDYRSKGGSERQGDYRGKGGSERRGGGYQRDEGARQGGYRRDGQGYRRSDDHRQREDHRRAEGTDRQNVHREGYSGGRSDNRGERSFNRNNARGSYQRDYRKRDDGSFNGRRDGDSRGGYRGKDGNSGKGGYRGNSGNGGYHGNGGYRKDRSDGSRGGQDSNRNYRSGNGSNRSNGGSNGYRGNSGNSSNRGNGGNSGYHGKGGNNHRNSGKGGYRGGSQNRGANGNGNANSSTNS